MNFYPLKFESIFKETIWGGRALECKLGKRLPKGRLIGESWELSGQKDNVSIVANGEFAGMNLNELVSRYPKEILGQSGAPKGFSLLIKFIDANDKLSIQVHPDDDYASRNEGDRGKTESWYIVDAAEDSRIICGLKKEGGKPLTRKDVERGLADGSLERYLNSFDVAAGDVVYVPAGTVHAIESGALIYEVQEASDVTYRLFDWGRRDAKGKARRLDVEKSLCVMNYGDYGEHRTSPLTFESDGNTRSVLVGCKYFVLERHDISRAESKEMKNGFEVLTSISGSGVIGSAHGETKIGLGETILIPAAVGEYELSAASGGVQALLTYVPRSLSEFERELVRLGASTYDIERLGGIRKGV